MENNNQSNLFDQNHRNNEEGSGDHENHSDRQKSEEENCEESRVQGQAAVTEGAHREESHQPHEQDHEEEAEDDSSEDADPQAKEKADLNSQPRSYYAPPQYSTSHDGAGYGKEKGAKHESAFGKTVSTSERKGIVLKKVSIAICLLAAMAVGAVAGFWGSHMATKDIREAMSDENYNIFGSPIQVVKNDGSIKVNEVIGSTGYSNLTVSQVAELVSDSVVEIFTQSQSAGYYVTSGAGSGVIYAQGGGYGYIVTNYHVVGGSSAIGVRLTDGSQYQAEYLDGDEREDIAVIRIQTNDELSVAVFGSSSADSLHVGEEVVAIGNPLGQLGGTVTNGIISALDRSITIDGVTMQLLQTNAAVNPGNSGGGLFNMAGELIGIVNAKKLSTGIEGLGFAIPIDNVYDMLLDVLENGYIQGRITFGMEIAYADAQVAYQNFRSVRAGIYVVEATSSSFRIGDLIYAIGEKQITSESDYYAALADIKVGDTVTFTIYRNNAKKTVTVEAVEYVPSMFS